MSRVGERVRPESTAAPMVGRPAVLTIGSVCLTDSDAVRAAFLDTPVDGQAATTYAFRIAGWVVGAVEPVAAVEVRVKGVVHARAPVDTPRPDVAEHHSDVEWSTRSGFECTVNGARLPDGLELDLVAVFRSGARSPLARIAGALHRGVADAARYLQPVMLTTLGRSGSTWVTRLLGQHPEITTYQPFRFEPRAASYWMEMFGALSHPQSYQQNLAGELYGPDWWTGTRRSAVAAPKEGTLEEWLGAEQADCLLPFCMARIEAFYREAARMEKKGEGVRLFCEKFTTSSFVQTLMTSLYPGARELILVRDFRDMVCSMFSYNEKRGQTGFGRDQVETDEEFVLWWQGGVEQLVHEWQERADQCSLLRYEDLVLRPREVLPSVLEYIGVASDERTVEELLRRATELTPRAQKLHSTTPDPAASVGRWETDLGPSLSRAAETAFGESLARLGYAV